MRLLAFLFCAILFAQPTEPKPARITLEQQAEYLQARAELAEARLAVKDAEAKISLIVSRMQGTCALQLDAGRPQCIPQPKSPEPKK